VGKLGCDKGGFAVDEDDVAADAQRGCGEGELDGFFGGAGAGHEGGAGELALAVQLEDGAIDAAGEAKVVGVYYQALH